MSDNEPSAKPRPSDWWTGPQAVVWICTRNDTAVKEAAKDRMFRDARWRKSIQPASVNGAVPISPEAAPAALCAAARDGIVEISGSKAGKGTPEAIALTDDMMIQDHEGDACVVNADRIERDETAFWSQLWISADQCRQVWPAGEKIGMAPPAQAKSTGKGGRPPEYDWEAALAHVAARASLDGLPDRQAETARWILDYFSETNSGLAPVESEAKKRARLVHAALTRINQAKING